MARKRHRLNWNYDDEIQQFTTPSGRTITLQDIAALLQNQIECWHDFQGPWAGWRMRGNRLIPPGHSLRSKAAMAPHVVPAFLRWLSACGDQQGQRIAHQYVDHQDTGEKKKNAPISDHRCKAHRQTYREHDARTHLQTLHQLVNKQLEVVLSQVRETEKAGKREKASLRKQPKRPEHPKRPGDPYPTPVRRPPLQTKE